MRYLKPTCEQQAAIDYFQTGHSLKVMAFAGTGKTATLKMLAGATDDRGTYIAFNRALALDARRRFPSNVECLTTHQLAYRAVAGVYGRDRNKLFGTMNANYVVKTLDVKGIDISGQLVLKPRMVAAIILETVGKFMQSDDSDIHPDHVPEWGRLSNVSEDQWNAIRNKMITWAEALWRRMIDHGDSAPLGHSGYFKRWALSKPVIPGDFILVDEAQDINPVMLGVLKRQYAQVIYVGDSYQQVYQWRGAIDAMDQVATRHSVALTLSFRFGQDIADMAGRLLNVLGESSRIRGNPRVNSTLRCTHPRAILCRSNAGVMENLISALTQGDRPHVINGGRQLERLLESVRALKAGQEVDHPEFFGFTSWSAVVAFSESDEGAHLRTLVALVDRYGEDRLLASLNRSMSREEDASVVLSTVHRAKGRQWPGVRINDDFAVHGSPGEQPSKVNTEELRLLYVAVTRAETAVEIPVQYRDLCGIR